MPQKLRNQKHAAGVNAALHKALAHPLRERILVVLSERTASPTELSELLEEDFDLVAYHVRVLAKADLIELVDTDSRHGGKQHFYKSSVRPILDTAGAERLPQLLRETSSVSIIPLVIGDLIESVEAKAFDSRPARSLLRMAMVVDELGMEESGEAALAYLDTLCEIQARSASRLAEKGDTGFNVQTATLVFPMPDEAGD